LNEREADTNSAAPSRLDTPRLHLGTLPWRPDRGRRRDAVPAQARRAERLGYDSFWLPESHFVPAARPAPLLELAAAAAVTGRLRLGVTSYLLPIRNPILAAEEVAVLDRLSGGRLVLGLGRGFRRELFDAFGVDRAAKRQLFEAALRVMLRAWRGEPLDGAPRAGDDEPAAARIHPRCEQEPHPPLWVAAFGPKALRQAARLGLPYLASPLETFERLRRNLELYRAERESASAEPVFDATGETPVPILRTVFVSRSRRRLEEARRALEPEIARGRRLLAELGDRPGEDGAGSSVDDHALLGDPDQVARRIERLRAELGSTHLVARMAPGIAASAAEESLRELAALPR
jgi:alkanesulfonate monooxygenase SsuD/methylene tetrahydromethanopterin reductase-like flavin-dependent oxidoreductase (luciferase family)